MMLRILKRVTCRFCGKWILMVKTARGKTVPVDPKSRYYRENPRGAAFVRMDGEIVRGSSCDRRDSRAAGIGYLNHDATCKDRRRSDRCKRMIQEREESGRNQGMEQEG